MKRFASVVLATALAAVVPFPTAAAQAGPVKITVNYKGKGTVDRTRKLWVYLFATPDIGPTSQPIGQVTLDQNGAVAAFDGIGSERVWVAVAFDEQGVMDGNGPPPTGSPIGILMDQNGAPASVVPGERGMATLTFDDSVRMP
jgi:hypothetical protein